MFVLGSRARLTPDLLSANQVSISMLALHRVQTVRGTVCRRATCREGGFSRWLDHVVLSHTVANGEPCVSGYGPERGYG